MRKTVEARPKEFFGHLLKLKAALLTRRPIRKTPPKEFFSYLLKLCKTGSEVPLAALIYGLVDIHRDPSKRDSLPNVLDLIYGSIERNEAIFARADILKLVLDKYEKEHRPNWWEFKVWKAYANLASHRATFLGSDSKRLQRDDLKKALNELVRLLEERGNYPHIEPPQADAICSFYKLIELAVQDNVETFLDQVDGSEWPSDEDLRKYELQLEDAIAFLRRCQHKPPNDLKGIKPPKIVYPLESTLLEIVFEYITSGLDSLR